MPTKDEIRQFSELIERIVFEKDISYIDAIVHHCEQNGFELELAASLLSAPVKAKISEEAQSANMIKKVNALPI
jgi:hypothetical protein